MSAFNGSNMDVGKFFFIYDNVIMKGKEDSDKAADLIKYLDGPAFDVYYETYADGDSISKAAGNYSELKKLLKDKFKQVENPETVIQMAVNAMLDESFILNSLEGIQKLYEKAGFDRNAKYGLLRNAIRQCKDEVSQFVFYQKPTNYEELVKATKDFVTYKESTRTNRSSSYGSKQVLLRSDVSSRALESKVDSLTKQMAELTLLVKKSQIPSSDVRNAGFSNDVPTCSYCKEGGHYATGCSKNPDRDTTCPRCGKKGHSEPRCWKKKKDTPATTHTVATTELETREEPTTEEHGPTASTVIEDPADFSEVVAAAKRTAEGEPLPKQTRMEGVVPLSSLMNHSIARSQAGSKNPILRKKSKKNKRSKTGILSIEHHVGIYDVISELAKASCGLTFGQLARGDAEEAKKRLRRMLSPSAKKKRTVAAPVGEIPRRLKIIRIAVSGTDAESLFDSGASPNLLSSSLCQRLSLEVIKTDRRITVANGNKTGVTGIVTDVPISLGDNLIVSMDFLVIDNPPFDVIIGQPALEALQAIIDFGKQEVRLTVGPNSTILGFEYAGESLPKDNVSGTDSEDFTSGSDAAPSEASDDEADVADYFVGLITECEEEPSFVADEHEDEERKRTYWSLSLNILPKMRRTFLKG